MPSPTIAFAIAMSITIPLASASCPKTCKCSSVRMTCYGKDTPKRIPDGILDVILEGYQPPTKGVKPFSDPSWAAVTSLDIKFGLPYKQSKLVSNFFQGLHGLKTLGIHGITPETEFSLENGTFAGLKQVLRLNITNNPGLTFSEIVKSLSDKNIMPGLKLVDLSKLQSHPIVSCETMDSLFKSLSSRPVEILLLNENIFNCTLFYSIAPLCNTLRELHIVSSGDMPFNNTDPRQLQICQSLHFLDLTQTTSFLFWSMFNQLCLKTSCGFFTTSKYFFHIRELVLNNAFTVSRKTWSPGVYNASEVRIKTQKLQLCNVNFQSLNVSFENMLLPSGFEVALSGNSLTYLNPNIVLPGTNVAKINLSYNLLQQMEEQYPQEFAKLLHNYKDLIHITISHNRLHNIPSTFFKENLKLRIIDLSNNLLRFFTVEIRHLSHLNVLDLRSNRFQTFPQETRELLAAVCVEKRDLSIYLGQNDFQCDCSESTKDFVRWVMTTTCIKEAAPGDYMCEFYEEHLDMNRNATVYIDQICHRLFVKRLCIILSCTLAVVIVIVGIIVFVTFRRKRKAKRVERFIELLRKRKLEDMFLMFLSHCKEDGDLAHKILPDLNRSVQKISFRTDNYVCLSELQFRPGFPIINEINRNMKSSYVVIFLVSSTFCRKEWCHVEINEAMKLKKPVILIFTEIVDVARMPENLQKLYNRNARTRLSESKPGVYVLKPSWDKFCQAVIELAVDSKNIVSRSDFKEGTSKDTNGMVNVHSVLVLADPEQNEVSEDAVCDDVPLLS